MLMPIVPPAGSDVACSGWSLGCCRSADTALVCTDAGAAAVTRVSDPSGEDTAQMPALGGSRMRRHAAVVDDSLRGRPTSLFTSVRLHPWLGRVRRPRGGSPDRCACRPCPAGGARCFMLAVGQPGAVDRADLAVVPEAGCCAGASCSARSGEDKHQLAPCPAPNTAPGGGRGRQLWHRPACCPNPQVSWLSAYLQAGCGRGRGGLPSTGLHAVARGVRSLRRGAPVRMHPLGWVRMRRHAAVVDGDNAGWAL